MPSVEVAAKETLLQLVKTMLQTGVNSIIITENQAPIGMINDKEILKEIVENKKAPEKTLAKDLAYTPLIALGADESIMQAVKVMREKGMKRAAMIKNGRLVAMLTEDLAKKMSVTA